MSSTVGVMAAVVKKHHWLSLQYSFTHCYPAASNYLKEKREEFTPPLTGIG